MKKVLWIVIVGILFLSFSCNEFTAPGIKNAAAKIEKVSAEVDQVQEHVAVVAQAIKETDTAGKDNASAIIEIAQGVNKASRPFNPYSGIIDAILAAAAAVFGWIATKKSKEVEAAQLKYQAHKEGAELTMKQVSTSTLPDVKAVEVQLYDNIGTARERLGVT